MPKYPARMESRRNDHGDIAMNALGIRSIMNHAEWMDARHGTAILARPARRRHAVKRSTLRVTDTRGRGGVILGEIGNGESRQREREAIRVTERIPWANKGYAGVIHHADRGYVARRRSIRICHANGDVFVGGRGAGRRGGYGLFPQ